MLLYYYLQIATFAITLAIIFIAVKWFHLGFVTNPAKRISDPAMRRMYVNKQSKVRLAVVLLTILFDSLIYFFYDYTGAGYLALMVVMTFPFIAPTPTRIASDYQSLFGEEEKG